jgi:hypothetical protein
VCVSQRVHTFFRSSSLNHISRPRQSTNHCFDQDCPASVVCKYLLRGQQWNGPPIAHSLMHTAGRGSREWQASFSFWKLQCALHLYSWTECVQPRLQDRRQRPEYLRCTCQHAIVQRSIDQIHPSKSQLVCTFANGLQSLAGLLSSIPPLLAGSLPPIATVACRGS